MDADTIFDSKGGQTASLAECNRSDEVSAGFAPRSCRMLGREGVFLLFRIALFDLVQDFLPAEQVDFHLREGLPGHKMKLIVDDGAPGNRAARWNQLCSPLEDQAEIPDNKNAQSRRKQGRRYAPATQVRRYRFEQDREPEDEKNGERNKKAISE